MNVVVNSQQNISLTSNAVIPPTVQAELDKSLWEAPSLDAWLRARLSGEHQNLYARLMQSRYSSTEPFPVEFEQLYEQLGYSRPENPKEKLTSQYEENIDWVISHPRVGNSGRGRPATSYALTIDCAQRFALAAGTEKGKQIRDFFVKTLAVVQEYHMLTILIDQRKGTLRAKHDMLLRQYPNGKHVVYRLDLGMVDGEHLQKLGSTNELQKRAPALMNLFGCGYLTDIVETHFNRELEAAVKNDACADVHRVKKFEVKGKNQTELYRINEQFTDERFGSLLRELNAKVSLEMQTAGAEHWAKAEWEKARAETIQKLMDGGIMGDSLKEVVLHLFPLDGHTRGDMLHESNQMDVDPPSTSGVIVGTDPDMEDELQMFREFQSHHIMTVDPIEKARLPRTLLTTAFRAWAGQRNTPLPPNKRLWDIFDKVLGTMFVNQWDGVKLRGWKHLRILGLTGENQSNVE